MSDDKVPNCPFCAVDMIVGPDKDHPYKCPKCEREWGYVGQGDERSLMSKRRRVLVSLPRLERGAKVDDVIKPAAPHNLDRRTLSTGERDDDSPVDLTCTNCKRKEGAPFWYGDKCPMCDGILQ